MRRLAAEKHMRLRVLEKRKQILRNMKTQSGVRRGVR